MITENDIIRFLKDETYEERDSSVTDVFNDYGIAGDDCTDLLNAYQKKYNVDMSDFLWYFHHEEEGNNIIGNSFFKTPDKRVTRIPITPKMLTEFANSKKWKINYPEHKLPKYRYDLIINFILLIIVIVWLIVSLVKKYLI